MAVKKYIKVEKGNVKAVSPSGIVYRLYYGKGDAVRADWEDEVKETVQVQTSTGRILIISAGGITLKSF